MLYVHSGTGSLRRRRGEILTSPNVKVSAESGGGKTISRLPNIMVRVCVIGAGPAGMAVLYQVMGSKQKT